MSVETQNRYQKLKPHGNQAEVEQECASGLKHYVRQGSEQISGMIQDKPSRSLLVTCLAGIGIGFLASRYLAARTERSSFDRGSAERFGRSLLAKLEHSIPDSIRERFAK